MAASRLRKPGQMNKGAAKPNSVIHRYSYGVLRAHLTSFSLPRVLSNLSIINSPVRVGVGERENAWDLPKPGLEKGRFSSYANSVSSIITIMGRERQKKKNRSSVRKATLKPNGRTKTGKRKVNFLGNPIIAENW
jgi:hypothetical protein